MYIYIVSFLNLMVIPNKAPSSFWFETCLNWVSGYQPSEHPRLVRTLMSIRSDVSIRDEKEGSRAFQVITSSKHPKWLFVMNFVCLGKWVWMYIYLYMKYTYISWRRFLFLDSHSLLGFQAWTSGIAVKQRRENGDPTAGGRWQEAPFWGGLETTWYHDIPRCLEGDWSVTLKNIRDF